MLPIDEYEIDVEFEQTDSEVDADFGNFQHIGVPGDPGDPGASAYEVAVKNGFEGTEEEWLESLRGETGLEALMCSSYLRDSYSIGDTAGLMNTAFNRTPVVGDRFTTLCGGKYFTAFEVIDVNSAGTRFKCIGYDYIKGDKGETGVGIESIKTTVTSTKDGGENQIAVTLTNGSRYPFSVYNGSKGSKGDPGYSPVKGTDYYTEADKAEMVQAVISALPVYDGSVTSV